MRAVTLTRRDKKGMTRGVIPWGGYERFQEQKYQFSIVRNCKIDHFDFWLDGEDT